eukprot:Hpha_TRINITY_DN16312_c1_g14::TRINITY_DN16312_c1_g14_i1::g.59648::m.59648
MPLRRTISHWSLSLGEMVSKAEAEERRKMRESARPQREFRCGAVVERESATRIQKESRLDRMQKADQRMLEEALKNEAEDKRKGKIAFEKARAIQERLERIRIKQGYDWVPEEDLLAF